jgi:hypothetical protein
MAFFGLIACGVALSGCMGASDKNKSINNSTNNLNNVNNANNANNMNNFDEINNGNNLQPGQLTAGEWNDLEHWDFWKELQVGSYGSFATQWQMNTLARYAVVVVDGAGGFVTDARVRLLDEAQTVLWETRTDNRGRANLFAGAFGGMPTGPFTIEALSGEAQAVVNEPGAFVTEPEVIVLPDAPAPELVLDLMFMIDTTGSMGDELHYLQAELADVISEVRVALGQQVSIRLSVNFYRDAGDEYVVRTFPFTTDLAQALQDLEDQDYDGGGDYPEAVVEALESVVEDHAWSPSARARLCFLVLDAPPHETPQNLELMQGSVRQAAHLGVRVIPVAASGIDTGTEFFLRFVDILTNATYVFLTDHSGIGGDHLEPTVGEYEVELLNSLLKRLIVQSVDVVSAE